METVHNKRENQQRNLTVESCNDGQGVRVSTGAKKDTSMLFVNFFKAKAIVNTAEN